MDTEAAIVQVDDAPEDLPHLKSVSRIKHIILQNYLPKWAMILGGGSKRLNYFDCFAGPGRYECMGEAVDGSPAIALKAAKAFLAQQPQHSLNLILTDENRQQVKELQERLDALRPFPAGLQVNVLPEDSKTFIPQLLSQITRLAPSFFMIDPYGHPLSLSTINEILSRPQTEVLITLMWFRINMDMGNPSVQANVDRLFGNQDWRGAAFISQRGITREDEFLSYFKSRMRARYVLPFRIGYDSEDKVRGERTKYYLLHASNHPRAVLLMKEVMWPLGDEEGTFDYSGESQGVLISRSPQSHELREILLQQFAGARVAFDDIREQTWELPFIQKHYRAVIQQLRKEGLVQVTPVSSKNNGLKMRDVVHFPRRG